MIPLDELWVQYSRVIKDNGAIVLFAQPPFDKVLACSNLKLFRYEWVWHKTQPSGHLNAKRMPMKAHENILVFYKKLPTYNPQMTEGHERKVVSKKARIRSELKGVERADNLYQKGNIDIIEDYDTTKRYPRDVITFPKDTQKSAIHPTQKPVDLLRYLIRTYTNEGDIVLDNTMGSGSTGVACVIEGRDFIGMELDEGYYKKAVDRINKQKIDMIGD